MVLLIDIDNCYAACERLFRPDLRNRPIIVLSSESGCVVARCRFSKKLGVKMGVPYFKIKYSYEESGGVAFASNFPLYAHISNQVAICIEKQLGDVERASIDECFASSHSLRHIIDSHGSYEAFGKYLRATVMKETGISVSVGIGRTKTLSKAGTWAAKRYPATGGVVAIETDDRLRKLLSLQDVNDVWGVGRRYAERLRNLGLKTAWDLKCYDQVKIKKMFGLVLQRTVMELNSERCIEIEMHQQDNKQMVSSRTFVERTSDYHKVRGSLAKHVSTLAEKLRKRRLRAKFITVFIQSSPFDKSQKFTYLSRSAEFHLLTNDTPKFLETVDAIMLAIWKDCIVYSKCGVMISGLESEKFKQFDFFDESERKGDTDLMRTLDSINNRFAMGVVSGSSLLAPQPRASAILSPNYTGAWSDVPIVR